MDFDETGLYKGFVKNVEGQKYPGRNPEMMSLTEADEQESYSGVLNDNVVLLDADEQPYSDILLKIIEGEKLGAYVTDRQGGRGIHALMINGAMNSKKADKVMLACGIVVDFHPAYSAHYECLKYQGEERKVIYDESPYQAMPKYFTPIPKCTIDFTNLGEGDGRNSALFGYILTLQNAGLEKEDIRETIRILNKYVLNGKSTYLHMIECMLGKDNFCSVDVKDFKQRFAPIMTFGKLANIGDDISSEYIEDTSLLKKMITGEVIRAEDKGKPAINFTPYATHIFSANDIPRMKDRTGAMLRRMLIVPFNGNFTADTPGYDPEIRYKLGTAECMEYFIQCALKTIK